MQRGLSSGIVLGFCLLLGSNIVPAGAGEIGWIEQFALAPDRRVPLEQLIPGTEDFYYYHALHYQQTEQWAKVDELLKPWIERHGRTARVHEIENRQALLTYPQDPQRALTLIRQRLDLRFDHQKEELNQKPNLPTTLDPALLTRERLREDALRRFPHTLEGFEDAALDWLVAVELDAERRRVLLSRLQRPDYPQLVELIVADLNHPHSEGFGQFEIHRRLLLAQLDELLKLKPELLNQSNLVQAYLLRLRPSDDVNWRQDPAALRAYLERLQTFVARLAPVHNSLKAHVLYHRLLLERSEGKYPAELFFEYLQLPKHASYVEPKYLELGTHRQHAANLQQDFTELTKLPPVGDDEPLVRDYLRHFFLTAEDYERFAPYVHDTYLKHLFAETKIVHGLGDAERWYALLPPSEYQALKERIDLDFAPTNRTELAADDPVALDLYVKNVDTLIVKVFEINTQNYYRDHKQPIRTDINLDGLVANMEKTFTYNAPPLRRVRRHFEFPKLNHRGVFVIDFIGNGKASRALIVKGQLRHLVRTSVAGQVFTIFDEQNKPLPDATLWLAGTLYTPNKAGEIVTPYSNEPGNQPIVLSQENFSSLANFEQESENYKLAAGFHVDREELLALRKSQLLVRPQLLLNGTPVTAKVLENVRLIITSTDLEGIVTTKEVDDFKLFEDRETVYELQTPPRLSTIHFALKAQVKNQSHQKTLDLSAEQSFVLNTIDKTEHTEDLHIARIGTDYVIDVLGKTGEAKADRPVNLTFKLRDFTQPVHVSLQSNARGRIHLGPLPGVTIIAADTPRRLSRVRPVRDDEHTYHHTIHAAKDAAIEVPYLGAEKEPARSELSLIELRNDTFLADRFEHLAIREGLLVIEKLPPGDYSLWIKPSNTQIRLRIAEGERRENYVLGDYRRLEILNAQPLQLEAPQITDDAVRLQLRNVTPQTRVHVFATRFQPAYSAYNNLARLPRVSPYAATSPRAESLYVAGRNIGDEYRYILDRRFAQKYPGNLLERPSLLLNPWAIRKTETSQQAAQTGEEFEGRGGGADMRELHKLSGGSAASESTPSDFSNLDFLAHTSLVLANLVPDKNGVITVPRDELGAHQNLVFVAIDPHNTVSRHAALPEAKSEFLDLRLAAGLDPKQHFTQQKQITLVPQGEQLVIDDITSTRFESYDSLDRVWNLYAALSNDPKFAEFAFLTQWPTLSPEAKREKYEKYASHELHFFLARRDPEFFDAAIRPYLANKKDKQLIDRYLLEEDLTAYQAPKRFSELNTFERILLARRLNDQATIAQGINDKLALTPPNVERFNHLFQTALQSGSLETGDKLGVRVALDELSATKRQNDLLAELAPQEEAEADDPFGNGLAGRFAAPAPSAAPAMEDVAGKDRDSLLRRRESGKKEKEYLSDERKQLAEVAQYYRQLDKTMEWVESNYYHLPIDQQRPELIGANRFWQDFARHEGDGPFRSTHLAEASHTFPEMLMALAVLDLPFEAAEHETKFDGTKMTLSAGSPMIVYHEEIQPASKVAENSPILVSQNFFRHGDRHRQEQGEQVDKFVTEEFLIDTVYGCHLVVTNPSSGRKKVDVLLQIPTGSLPVAGGQATRSVSIDLAPYHTQTLEYHFYFPATGDFPHYPVQVAQQGEVLGYAAPFKFHVVKELTQIDKESWDYLSQHGTPDEVLEFLRSENLFDVKLDRIAWRMRDKAFFNQALTILQKRHIYDNTLWSYAVSHNDAPHIRRYLPFEQVFVQQTGQWLDSPLLVIDPVAGKAYEHMEYRPLVNARVGQLGRQREILNDRFLAQYQRLLKILSYHEKLNSEQRLAVTYYLLLQDRIEEALAHFKQIKPDDLETRLQYDYFDAYLAFYEQEPARAKKIAAGYKNYPVERWREAFANVVNQVEEIEAHDVQVADAEDRTQQQTRLAAQTPSFDFQVEAKRVQINFQNLKQLRVNYYLMDIELLFSHNPFVQGDARQFANILPNQTQTVELPANAARHEFPLPAELANRNVLVEISGGGGTQSRAYYSNALRVQVIENFGQVQVLGLDGKPLPKVYVKVYARMRGGEVRFYKDGYTDLRGRFDYTSLSTNELEQVEKFSLLILSEEQGAVVREAQPPKR